MAIEYVTQSSGGSLPWDSEAPLCVDVADYDLDGFLDLMILAGWGTGGSWYHYYRWNRKKYVEWKEPQELGINHFELHKKVASSGGRSCPAWKRTYYNIRKGHFFRFRTEIFAQAKDRRELVPKEILDDEYVLIVEDYDGARLKSRRIKRGNPEALDR